MKCPCDVLDHQEVPHCEVEVLDVAFEVSNDVGQVVRRHVGNPVWALVRVDPPRVLVEDTQVDCPYGVLPPRGEGQLTRQEIVIRRNRAALVRTEWGRKRIAHASDGAHPARACSAQSRAVARRAPKGQR